jgi:hypothetical protein
MVHNGHWILQTALADSPWSLSLEHVLNRKLVLKL